MEKALAKPSVFDYTDYREYLSDVYTWESSTSRYFSYQYLADKMELSKGKIHKIWTGQIKNFPKSLLVKTSEFLNHNRREQEYFSALISFNEAEKPEDKTLFYEAMHRVIRPGTKTYLRNLQYQLFKEWYIPVIRELIALIDFQEDYAHLAQLVNPPIKAKQAKDAVQLLLELHLIEKKQGRYYQKNVTLETPREVKNLAIRHHQKQHLEMAIPAIENNLDRQHRFTNTTFGINEEGLLRVKDKINQFHSELVDLMAQYDSSMDQVYQFNLQLYPLSQRVEGPNVSSET